MDFSAIKRRLDEDEYVFPNPFLTCNWSWSKSNGDVEYPGILQECSYVVPDETDNEYENPFRGAYWITSRCSYETINANQFLCNVTDSSSSWSRIDRPKYQVECSVEALTAGMPARTACKSQKMAWIPAPKCVRECSGQQRRRHLEEDVEFTEYCTKCFYQAEKCKSFSFGNDKEKLDYNGIPWSDTFIETMQQNYENGNNHYYGDFNTVFYDIEKDQPSFAAKDFALDVTFNCPSGRYQGAALEKEVQTGAGLAILMLLFASGLTLCVVTCRRRPCEAPCTAKGHLETSDSFNEPML